MTYEIKAVYNDAAGNQFSAPVTRTDSGWRLLAANGERQIDYFIPDKDAAGGMLTFEDYSISTKENVRGCDFIQQVNAIRSLLPWPIKPSNPPSVQSEPDDSQIHIEPRQAGESSFRQLQQAGARAAAAHRANVERERREMLEKANQHDPYKVQQARNANNISAARMRPKRGE